MARTERQKRRQEEVNSMMLQREGANFKGTISIDCLQKANRYSMISGIWIRTLRDLAVLTVLQPMNDAGFKMHGSILTHTVRKWTT